MTTSVIRSFFAGRRAGVALALSAMVVGSGLTAAQAETAGSAQAVSSGPTAAQAQAADPEFTDPTWKDSCGNYGPQRVKVDGREINLDGKVWRPKGLQIRAWVMSLEKVKDPNKLTREQKTAKEAQEAFGPDMLGKARSVFGADMLRFQVSQPSLAGNDPAYKKKVTEAISLARCMGFVVNVSMQAQDRAGGPGERTPIASKQTKAAWLPMIREFKDDTGVLFEIYNEPGLGTNSRGWDLWAHARLKGRTDTWTLKESGKKRAIFGMQPMINYLRDKGSKNVLVVDAVQLADTFEGYNLSRYGLNDGSLKKRKNQILYAVHPYLRTRPANAKTAVLDRKFGTLAKKKPVIVTEWSAKQCAGGLMLGDADDYTSAVKLLNYLIDHQIPMSAGAFDAPGIMARNLTSYAPTNYDHFEENSKTCGTNTKFKLNNAGLLVQKMFQEDYFVGQNGKHLSAVDGVTDPKWVP